MKSLVQVIKEHNAGVNLDEDWVTRLVNFLKPKIRKKLTD